MWEQLRLVLGVRTVVNAEIILSIYISRFKYSQEALASPALRRMNIHSPRASELSHEGVLSKLHRRVAT